MNKLHMQSYFVKFIASVFISATLAGVSFSAQYTGVDEYLAQVESHNQEIKAIDMTLDSLRRKPLETEMAYSPYISAGAQYMKDKSGPTYGSTLSAKEMDIFSLNAAFNKKWDGGASLSVGYTQAVTALDLYSPLQLTPDQSLSQFTAYDVRPSVRFEQSLIKERAGGLTRSAINKTKLVARQGAYMQVFKRQQIIIKARSAYWALSLAREVVLFRQLSLERAEKLLNWNKKRVALDLADKTDLLQAQAAYKLRQLNYQLAVEDELKAQRAFSELMGKTGDTPAGDIMKLSDMSAAYASGDLKRTGERADVLAAAAGYESAHFALKEALHRTGPEVSVYGTASLHGLDIDYGRALSQAGVADKPSYGAGVVFSMPLGRSLIASVRKGYDADLEAAKNTLEKARISAVSDWQDMLNTWRNVKMRMALAVQIRDIQNDRVNNEQKKLERGRTTTFLLLTAENDLDDAIINVYRLMMEQLALAAQAELYNTGEIQ